MRDWLGEVWPPAWVFVLFCAGCVAMVAWMPPYAYYASGTFMWSETRELSRMTLTFAPILAMALYALYRVWGFHPALRPDGYGCWLQLTPWNAELPLPFGPVSLVAQDVLLLAIGTVPAMLVFPSFTFTGLRVFALVYLLGLLYALFSTRQWAAAYAVSFGTGAMIYVWPVEWMYFGAAALTYAVAYVGLQRSYRAFPWSFDQSTWFGEGSLPPAQVPEHLRTGPAWPYDLLGPADDKHGIPLWHAAVIALLTGWWYYAPMARINAEVVAQGSTPGFQSAGPVVFLALILAGSRLMGIYRCFTYQVPISWAGRIATGRWVIPGYDQIFVAPLLTVLVWAALPPLLVSCGLSWDAANAAGMTAAVLAVLTVGPSLRSWVLTGEHAIWPDSPPGSPNSPNAQNAPQKED
jgi:hypothetical protein